jgi:hypothetical protein
MDRLETVEKLMSIEEAFGAEIPDDLTQHSGGTREMVDWLELRLSNQRPNKRAQVFLKKLAKSQQRAEQAQGLNGTWRREQIAAIVREISILRETSLAIESATTGTESPTSFDCLRGPWKAAPLHIAGQPPGTAALLLLRLLVVSNFP